jgi:hypothetical protein
MGKEILLVGAICLILVSEKGLTSVSRRALANQSLNCCPEGISSSPSSSAEIKRPSRPSAPCIPPKESPRGAIDKATLLVAFATGVASGHTCPGRVVPCARAGRSDDPTRGLPDKDPGWSSLPPRPLSMASRSKPPCHPTPPSGLRPLPTCTQKHKGEILEICVLAACGPRDAARGKQGICDGDAPFPL